MKPFLTVVLLLALMLSMSACHIPTADTPPTTEPTTEPTTAPTAPVTAPAPDVELTVGETMDNLYLNPYFGLIFALPDGWRFTTDAQLCEKNGVTGSLSGVDLKTYLGDGSEFLTIMEASDDAGRVLVSLAKMSRATKGMGIDNYMPIAKDNMRVIYDKANNGIELLRCEIVDVTLSGIPTKALLYELDYTAYGISNHYVEAYLPAGDYMLTVISTAFSEEDALGYLAYFNYPTV